MRTWRSAPWATSPTALAISLTARPVSSEVEAISCEAEDTDPAPFATSIITVLRPARMSL